MQRTVLALLGVLLFLGSARAQPRHSSFWDGNAIAPYSGPLDIRLAVSGGRDQERCVRIARLARNDLRYHVLTRDGGTSYIGAPGSFHAPVCDDPDVEIGLLCKPRGRPPTGLDDRILVIGTKRSAPFTGTGIHEVTTRDPELRARLEALVASVAIETGRTPDSTVFVNDSSRSVLLMAVSSGDNGPGLARVHLLRRSGKTWTVDLALSLEFFDGNLRLAGWADLDGDHHVDLLLFEAGSGETHAVIRRHEQWFSVDGDWGDPC